MTSRRMAKISQAILETVSLTVHYQLKDPRVSDVTITRVDVSPDLRSAKIYYTVLGDEKDAELCQHGLQSARGFLQSKIADRLKSRNTPILSFHIDNALKMALLNDKLLNNSSSSSETLLSEADTALDHPEEQDCSDIVE